MIRTLIALSNRGGIGRLTGDCGVNEILDLIGAGTNRREKFSTVGASRHVVLSLRRKLFQLGVSFDFYQRQTFPIDRAGRRLGDSPFNLARGDPNRSRQPGQCLLVFLLVGVCRLLRSGRSPVSRVAFPHIYPFIE